MIGKSPMTIIVTGLVSLTSQILGLSEGTSVSQQIAQTVFGQAPAAQVVQDDRAIQLVNDPSTGGPVLFLINGQELRLESGEAIDLPAGQTHTIEFNGGGEDYGDYRYSLKQGVYKFKVSTKGWGLFKAAPTLAGTPSASPVPATAGQPSIAPATPDVGTPPAPSEDLSRRLKGLRLGSPLTKKYQTAPGSDAATPVEVTEDQQIPSPPPPGAFESRVPAQAPETPTPAAEGAPVEQRVPEAAPLTAPAAEATDQTETPAKEVAPPPAPSIGT